MKTITLSMMVSVEGFIACPCNQLNWHVLNEELERHIFTEVLDKADVILLGRVAYQRLAEHWPAAVGRAKPQKGDAPMSGSSQAPRRPGGNPPAETEGDLADPPSRVNRGLAHELVLLASPAVARAFMGLGLMGEHQLIVNPSAVGAGTGWFRELNGQIKADLLNTRSFECRHLVLFHRPAYEAPRKREWPGPDYVCVKKWIPRDLGGLPPEGSSSLGEIHPHPQAIEDAAGSAGARSQSAHARQSLRAGSSERRETACPAVGSRRRRAW